MAKFEKKTNNNKTFNKGPKPVKLNLAFVVTGVDQKGNDYDAASAKSIMTDLQNAGCFEKLSVSVGIAREKLNAGKGVMTLGRLQSYNVETEEIEVLLIGKNVELADTVKDMVIIPRVRTAYNSTEVTSILGFDVVPAMEA